MNIGEKIRYFRKRLGLSQKDVANRMNKTHATISRWEKNQRCPNATTLLNLSMVLGCKIEEFYQ